MNEYNNYLSNIGPEKMQNLINRAKGVKLIATDLDGTLFDGKHMLSDENLRALETLAARGIVLAAATGRSRTSIPDMITSLPGIKYLITANGAKLYLNGADELIFEKYLSPEALEYVRPLLSDDELMCEAFWDGTPHVEEARYIAARNYGIPRWFSDYFFNTRKPIANFETAVFDHVNEIENINYIFANDVVQERVRLFLAKRTDLYEFTSSFPFNYETGGVGVSKAAAVDFIAKLENISQEETLCFGDNDNDASMIEYAEIGIATANAVPLALAAADLITLSNEESGVAAALMALRLIGE